MKTALLDLNLLTALLWPAHEHHAAAHRWFRARSKARWATCPLTQLGFVRLVTNPAFSPDALSIVEALDLLTVNSSHAAHVFWTETLRLRDAVERHKERLQGHRQLTDIYLLALASSRGGVLATFDGGLRTLAAGSPLEPAIDIVPTR